MKNVVSYAPTPEGLAAVNGAIDAAVKNDARLVLVNTGRQGSDADPIFASPAPPVPDRKIIMGSTVQQILMEADCPVVAVNRGPDA